MRNQNGVNITSFKMAATGLQRKRQREIQDENKPIKNNFDYLRQQGDHMRRQVLEKRRETMCTELRRSPRNHNSSRVSMSRLQPLRAVHDLSSSNLSTCQHPPGFSMEKSTVPRSLRNLRRLSLPLKPANIAKTANNVSPPRKPLPKLEEISPSKLHTPPTGCIGGPLMRPSSMKKMRRTLSGGVQKPWKTLRGSIRQKVADQVRASVMKGKQDYALPNVTGQLDYLRFLSAQQDQIREEKNVTVELASVTENNIPVDINMEKPDQTGEKQDLKNMAEGEGGGATDGAGVTSQIAVASSEENVTSPKCGTSEEEKSVASAEPEVITTEKLVDSESALASKCENDIDNGSEDVIVSSENNVTGVVEESTDCSQVSIDHETTTDGQPDKPGQQPASVASPSLPSGSQHELENSVNTPPIASDDTTEMEGVQSGGSGSTGDKNMEGTGSITNTNKHTDDNATKACLQESNASEMDQTCSDDKNGINSDNINSGKTCQPLEEPGNKVTTEVDREASPATLTSVPGSPDNAGPLAIETNHTSESVSSQHAPGCESEQQTMETKPSGPHLESPTTESTTSISTTPVGPESGDTTVEMDVKVESESLDDEQLARISTHAQSSSTCTQDENNGTAHVVHPLEEDGVNNNTDSQLLIEAPTSADEPVTEPPCVSRNGDQDGSVSCDMSPAEGGNDVTSINSKSDKCPEEVDNVVGASSSQEISHQPDQERKGNETQENESESETHLVSTVVVDEDKAKISSIADGAKHSDSIAPSAMAKDEHGNDIEKSERNKEDEPVPAPSPNDHKGTQNTSLSITAPGVDSVDPYSAALEDALGNASFNTSFLSADQSSDPDHSHAELAPVDEQATVDTGDKVSTEVISDTHVGTETSAPDSQVSTETEPKEVGIAPTPAPGTETQAGIASRNELEESQEDVSPKACELKDCVDSQVDHSVGIEDNSSAATTTQTIIPTATGDAQSGQVRLDTGTLGGDSLEEVDNKVDQSLGDTGSPGREGREVASETEESPADMGQAEVTRDGPDTEQGNDERRENTTDLVRQGKQVSASSDGSENENTADKSGEPLTKPGTEVSVDSASKATEPEKPKLETVTPVITISEAGSDTTEMPGDSPGAGLPQIQVETQTPVTEGEVDELDGSRPLVNNTTISEMPPPKNPVVMRKKPGVRVYTKPEGKDVQLQQKIDHEIKMRDGTAKLLAASKHPSQLVEAAKNLLTSNARMIAYMSELQRRKTDEVLNRNKVDQGTAVPCTAKLAVSDIRIPLMWKETDHFKNRGDHRRFAVFCLWKIGTQIQDTILLKDVDRSMTDLTFDDVIIFEDVSPDFECQVEVYCHKLNDDHSTSTPRRIRKKFNDISTSVGRSVGRRLSGMKDDPEFMSNMIVGPKFEMIASATLTLSDLRDSIGIFDLQTNPAASNEGGSLELPLFGNFCCRLAGQPQCMVVEAAAGHLSVKPGPDAWRTMWCILGKQSLYGWPSERDQKQGKTPSLDLTITSDARVKRLEGKGEQGYLVQLSAWSNGRRRHYQLGTETSADRDTWMTALQQHIVDIAAWKQACDRLMEIDQTPHHERRSFYGKQQRSSLYDDTPWEDSDSPMTRILNRLDLDEECNSLKPPV